MNRPIIHIPLLLTLLLLVRPGSSLTAEFRLSPHEAPPAAGQADAEWRLLAPEGEEFSAMTPAPSIMTLPGNYAFEVRGERVLEREIYSGYAHDFVFVIESFRASHPQEIFDRAVQFATVRASFQREVMVDGHTAKEYKRGSATFSSRILCLVAKKHVYVLTLTARDEKNAFPERFLNSFKLSDQSVTRTPVTAGQPASAPVVAGEVFSVRDVTRKVVIVWKPQAIYTEQARSHHVTGRIVLKGVFGADGQVTDITVLTGLKYGLTEKAIEAARNLRFFPAEKDGRPVSQELNLEYGFNLYP